MNKTKLLHVTFEMKLGGTQQVIRQLVTGIPNKNIENHVLCIDGELGELGELIQAEGIPVVTYKRTQGFDYNLVKFIRSFAKEHAIDVVHCHQYTPYFYGLLGSLFSNAKVVFTEHGRFYPERSSWKRQLLNPLFEKFTSALTAISQSTAAALVKYENFSGKRIEVIYNGLAIDGSVTQSTSDKQNLRGELQIPQNAYIIGTIARLDPIKNHPLILKVMQQLVAEIPNLHFLLIGDGPERQNLKQLVKKFNLKEHVTSTGFIVKPQKYLSIMDIFLLPSFSEGTSMTLLESMAYSKPSIVTDVGGNSEIVEHLQTGIVIKNDNLEELKSAIQKLFKERELAETLGKNALVRYQQQFSEQHMISAYLDLYNRI